MFNHGNHKPPDLEATLADLVRRGVALAELVCSLFRGDAPIAPGEIVAIETLLVETLLGNAGRALVAGGTPEPAVRMVLPALEDEFRAVFCPRFRELARLMTPSSGSA
jgi:hypothetical protein